MDSAASSATRVTAGYKGQKIFEIGGTFYKKDHYPDSPEEDKIWLNSRNIFLFCGSKDFDLLYSEKLPEKIGKDFLKIAPVYNFFMKAEQLKDD